MDGAEGEGGGEVVSVNPAERSEEHGARGYMARDLEGNLWYFADYRPGAYWDMEDGQSD